jgi:hypothetical protein
MEQAQDIAEEIAKDVAPCRWPAWFLATALMIASFIASAALAVHIRPGAEAVAVAFPPWWSARHIFEAAASADAAMIRMTAIPWLIVVQPDSHDGIARLRQSGAWLAIDPQASAACLSTG